MRTSCFIFRITLLVVLLLVTPLWAGGIQKAIFFKMGKSSAVLKGGVMRGENNQYLLNARAGQKMTVKLSSLEDNAVFQIYKPNYHITTDSYGENISGETLDRVGVSDDAKDWKGLLPVTGVYLLVVSGRRGNTTYQLEVTVKKDVLKTFVERIVPPTGRFSNCLHRVG